MAISKAMHAALKALTFLNPNVKKTYKVERQLQEIPSKIVKRRYTHRYTTWDHAVLCGDHEVPVRVFVPSQYETDKALVFFHGGGWVTGNIDSYDTICANLASHVGCVVGSVDYRLAPEHKFPAGLEDCYAATREVFLRYLNGIAPEDICLIGDSAGGNLAAAVSLMAADRGEFLPSAQILIYPATYMDHTENSPYPSVVENGTDYLLTAQRVTDFMELYMSKPEDLENPYFAPLLSKNLAGQPRTLVISAEFCPLRDEGEAYGAALREAGCDVTIYRMKDALHGYFSLPPRFAPVRRTYALIREFLGIAHPFEAEDIG